MTRRAFSGFTAVVPDDWEASREATTYSEEGLHAPMRFRSPSRKGVLRVAVPWLDADEQPGADPDELESLAREWGLRRGVDEPLACVTGLSLGLATVTASYKIGDDFVEVSFLSDGTTLIRASYVCPWDTRDEDRAVRTAIVSSLRPA